MSVVSRKLILPALAMAVLLTGCGGSPNARYYTLQSSSQAIPAAPARIEYQIEVAPVSVPEQADQPQLMLRDGPGEGELMPMYSDRWSAPLGNEIRSALADTLTAKLGALDVNSLAPARDVPVWRVQANVQRFDMIVGGPVRLDATWRVRPIKVSGAAPLLCRTVIELPAQGNAVVGSLVEAQQQAVALLGQTIASAIESGGARALPASAEVRLLGCA
ncbi:membrane integrity-associated transporter subunit PqiC [Bordetella sp. 15P40C-2]|uniref:PqiC family protein n=1 Tax=Bordetella sp. 15P40C-2 TaxID=2572246 RepID=UPI0013242A41|nr:PqiC family protein [Bordetella sp. 15P40C-2]MVW70603.1 hypothetical protein [Bordetella sp. 15P40C-2]